MMKAGPRCFGIKSLAASEAEVEEAGYSPPVPVDINVSSHTYAYSALQEHTESHNTSRHGHHPEHAVDGRSMRRGCENSADDNHDGRKDYGRLPAEIVTGQTIQKLDKSHNQGLRVCSSLPDYDLADDFANKQRIRHARADGRSVLLGVFGLQKDIGHGH